MKFTPNGGRIGVGLARQGDGILLIVRDTGRGIARDFLPFTFERFHQQEAAETRRTGGLGLGLAIARHLVELHGGTIAVTSDGDGRGAEFTVRLPLVPTAESPLDG